ncbi:ABC transporter substrate-binding protein [Nocardioides dongxiaopingii]|uniref:ABC transporter substrate-binding protein n=1 Tax=Nocardioides sp. S-1144 TaxID=2582905 RepID=UPI00110D8A7D|nr:ABC transporter substrate-binding protein [Nocardioides sp. S-1144]QCW50087.1 ABC transporter substrate-binding protein [Nocardioides sp. S-1144]
MKRHTWVPAVGTLCAALVLAGCGAGGREEGDEPGEEVDTVGVTDTSVKIGAHFPLTGVAAPGYSEIPTGAQAYFDYVNAAGGINGRTIEYVVKDDGYDPSKTGAVTNELVLDEEIFAMVGGLGTPTHRTVVDFLNEEEVPDLFVSSGSLQWGDDVEAKPYTFGWQTDYESEGKIIGQYVAENLPDAKVGLFLQDDDFGTDGEKGLRQFLDDQIVSVQRYTSGNTEVAPQVTALQADGADVVIGFNTPSYTALTQLTALGLGYQPQWVYSNVGSDPTLVGGLLAQFSEGAVEGGTDALDGVMTTEYIAGVDAADDPWVQLWQKVWDEHGADGELTNYRIYGMSQAYAFVQALAAAGEDLTRDGLVEAVEGLGDAEGPQLAPFRYSADSHLGISGMRVVALRGGVGEPKTPVLVTDIGDAAIEEDPSAQAEDAPPESGVPE